MSKKTKGDFRIGSLRDAEVFEIDLTKMSTAFMAAYLSRPIDGKTGGFLTLKDEDMSAIARQSVILAHELMIQVQECVDKYGEK